MDAPSSTKDGSQDKNIATETPAKPPEQSVNAKCWWEEITGTSITLSPEYLLDFSTPWTAAACTHVLVPHDSVRAKREKASLSLTDRAEILSEIGRTFRRICPRRQSMVRFVGQEVHISSLNEKLLQAIWKSRPVFKGHKMKVVSRGLPFSNMSTSSLTGLAPQTRDELVQKVSSQLKSLNRSWKLSLGETFVIESLYEIKGLSGGPVFGGDLYIFSNRLRGLNLFMGYNLHHITHDRPAQAASKQNAT